MKIKNIILALAMAFSLSAFSMTDQQVISYIKQQAAAGKSQQQIGQELLARGVTPEQAERIKRQYGSQINTPVENPVESTAPNRTRRSINLSRSAVNEVTGDTIYFIEEYAPASGKVIYGHNIFNTNNPIFEPNVNIGTPQNYKLGPGDEVIIDIWGANEEHLRQVISPEGSIMIEQLGPVYLNGLSINEANKHIKNAFSRKYAGMNEEETSIQLTLGEARTIMVNILGEVETPGTFLVSPFASVFNALYLAGGINDIGSLRNIQVLRNGKKVAGVDVYEFLFGGNGKSNITLQEGDVIIVPPYDQLVGIEGNVKRPMYYELRPNETLETLMEYAGGFSGDAYSGMVRLQRQTGLENELFNIENGDFATYRLQDGDIVTVGTILDRYSNRVELQGAVMRPGLYAISPTVSTVGELIATAEGLREDAYLGRAILYREGPELQLQVIAIDLNELLSGKGPDIELKRNDMLVISSLEQIEDRGTLTIEGHVATPGVYPFAENTTLGDLIVMAGGLLDGASMARVDVARRITNPNATVQNEKLAEIFNVSIEGGLSVGQGAEFMLKPYDMVHVRISPGYEPQEVVTLEGEVLFSGDYVLEKRNERVSDLVKRAGGVLDAAYIKGAYLERKLTEAEYEARKETLRLAMAQSQGGGGDSISLSKIDVSDSYNVGINLTRALEEPGSTYDLILQPGDKLTIPQYQSTVKIAGDVMFPNSVVYEPGKKLSYYINQAGGYGDKAKKSKAFVVYLNGTVTKAKRNTIIEPGCQIIVPSKSPSSGVNWSQVLAFATSFTSVATMAATIANILTK